MSKRKGKGTKSQRRSRQPSRDRYSNTRGEVNWKEDGSQAFQAEAEVLRPLPDTSKREPSPDAEISRTRGRWFPRIIALGVATIAFGTVLLPGALGVLSAVVSAVGLLGMLTSKTPIVIGLSRLFGETKVDAFFRHLLIGLKGWAFGLGMGAICTVLIYIDFMKSAVSVLGGTYIIAFGSLFAQLSKHRRDFGPIYLFPLVPLLLVVTMLSAGALGNYQIARGSFDGMYAIASSRGALGDRFISQSRTMSEYAGIYFKNYKYSAAANRFRVALTHYREDYDLAATVNWRTERGIYLIDANTLSRLKQAGIGLSALAGLATLQGRPFVGAGEFERAVRARLEDRDLASWLSELLELSCRSKQKAREVEMKRTWNEFRQVLQDPLVISELEAQVRATSEVAAASLKVYVIPYYLDSTYVVSTLFLVGAEQLSALAAVFKVSAAWLTWRVFDYGSSIVKALLLLASFIACWVVAKRARAYNAKYEDPASSSDSSSFTFFAVFACLSFVISILTL